MPNPRGLGRNSRFSPSEAVIVHPSSPRRNQITRRQVPPPTTQSPRPNAREQSATPAPKSCPLETPNLAHPKTRILPIPMPQTLPGKIRDPHRPNFSTMSTTDQPTHPGFEPNSLNQPKAEFGVGLVSKKAGEQIEMRGTDRLSRKSATDRSKGS